MRTKLGRWISFTIPSAETRLATRRNPRVLTVVHAPLRFVPAVDPRFSHRGEDVVATLDRICAVVGLPNAIRVVQGAQLTLRDMKLWARGNDVMLDFIRRATPTGNACAESFNAIVRMERLGQRWFTDLDDARRKVENRRSDYNDMRPHDAVGETEPTALIQSDA